jgi:hypothetical protein
MISKSSKLADVSTNVRVLLRFGVVAYSTIRLVLPLVSLVRAVAADETTHRSRMSDAFFILVLHV